MRAKQLWKFNGVCIALCAVFLVGTIFTTYDSSFSLIQDRFHTSHAASTNQPMLPAVSYQPSAMSQIVDNRNQITSTTHDSSFSLIQDRLHTKQTPDIEVLNNITIEQYDRDESSSTAKSLESGVQRLATAFPARVNLPVPFTSQAPEANWDQPWQDACEEAAVLMLDAYYKKYGLSPFFARDEIIKMVSWEEEREWERSIEIAKVKELTVWYMGKQITNNNQQIIILEDPTVDDIKQSIANGHPVYAVAYGKDLPNPNFRNGGPEYHALIIRGYTEDSFITNDPGTRNGENFVYKYDDLMNAIHDWNGGKVQSGKKVVLMVR